MIVIISVIFNSDFSYFVFAKPIFSKQKSYKIINHTSRCKDLASKSVTVCHLKSFKILNAPANNIHNEKLKNKTFPQKRGQNIVCLCNHTHTEMFFLILAHFDW